ncbi:MAG TPA: hypothetical protein VM049_13355 [Gaiellaceae bacterium]|nr:hypothetical protein [Gaiellaceae bacterium]
MKKLTAALALAGALIFATGALAVDFGANDDTGKYLAGESATYFGQMAAAGLRQNVMTLKWDPAAPMTVPDKAFLDAALPAAQAAGIKVVFAVYGAKPTTFTGDGGMPEAFAAWVGQVARTYPSVRNFIVGNEPNQPRFWRPQFDGSGAQASAAAFGPVLAAAYDALKAVSPEIQVVGIGLSPRGNDRPDGASNVSTSPVRFLGSLGAWYRSSGRARPLLDALSFHPYPNANTDSPTSGYAWPNVGLANADRLKQAVEDAFGGSGQPTVRSGLKLFYDELGWQVDTSANGSYAGTENVPVTTEANQAAIYGQIPRLVACDPAVGALNIFGFVDESDRGAGFQAGLYRKDGTARPSLSSFSEGIAGGCSGGQVAWSPATGVVGAAAKFNDSSPKPAKQTAWNTSVTASEDASAKVGLFRIKNASATRCAPGRVDVLQAFSGPGSPNLQRVLEAEFTVKAGYTPLLQLGKQPLASGCYFYATVLTAAMNASRQSTFVSDGFLAGPAAKTAPKPRPGAKSLAKQAPKKPNPGKKK